MEHESLPSSIVTIVSDLLVTDTTARVVHVILCYCRESRQHGKEETKDIRYTFRYVLVLWRNHGHYTVSEVLVKAVNVTAAHSSCMHCSYEGE
jgi:ribulose-5-phosphate 4-epimerase/fuculose-1-phosphate aldolase